MQVVKIISTDTAQKLEDKINEYLQKMQTSVNLFNVDKIEYTIVPNGVYSYSALLLISHE